MLSKKFRSKKVSIDGITFDSQKEGECYKILRAWCWQKEVNLYCHKPIKVGIYTWKVDFTLFPFSADGQRSVNLLAARFCRQLFNNSLYVEYKGIIDKNFDKKFNYYCKQHTTFSNSVILVSQKESGYTAIKKDRIITHPVLSLKSLKLLLNLS